MGCNGGGARNTRIYRRVLRVLQFCVGEGRTVGRERRLLLLARKSPVVSAVAQPLPPSFCPRFPPSVINVVPSPRIPPFPHTPDRRRISRISSPSFVSRKIFQFCSTIYSVRATIRHRLKRFLARHELSNLALVRQSKIGDKGGGDCNRVTSRMKFARPDPSLAE